jgi:hypothetical protein
MEACGTRDSLTYGWRGMSHPCSRTRRVHQRLARDQTTAGYLSFLIFSPESTRTILSKMAALHEVLVSDLNKMSAEELRSRV